MDYTKWDWHVEILGVQSYGHCHVEEDEEMAGYNESSLAV